MSDRDIHEELERKDAENLRQQERGADSNERLHGYDKTDADSFPASDPPTSMTPQKPPHED
jgi:hypothetical protein